MFYYFNVSLTVHHELTIQNYQRDALNNIQCITLVILYGSIICLLQIRCLDLR